MTERQPTPAVAELTRLIVQAWTLPKQFLGKAEALKVTVAMGLRKEKPSA